MFIDQSMMSFDDKRQAFINGVARHESGLVYVDTVTTASDLGSETREELGNPSSTAAVALTNPAGAVLVSDLEPYLPEERFLNFGGYAYYLMRRSNRQWRRTFNHQIYKLLVVGGGFNPWKQANTPSYGNTKVLQLLGSTDPYPTLQEAVGILDAHKAISVAFAPNYCVVLQPFMEEYAVYYRSQTPVGLVSPCKSRVMLSDLASDLVEDLSQYAEVELYNYG